MNEKSLQKLEYAKVIELLKRECATDLGSERADALMPSRDYDVVLNRQRETDEARSLLVYLPDLSLRGVKDIRNAVSLVKKNGVLDGPNLRDILVTSRTGKNFKNTIIHLKQESPVLKGMAQNIVFVNSLETAIETAIGEDGEVLDSASPKLGELRRKRRSLHNRIHEKLDHIVHSGTGKYLQEAIITIRNDRYVVPVRSEYRNEVPGIVHDQSASGATLFIEPMSVLELNNDMKKLSREEEEEIRRILLQLSAKVADAAPELINNLKIFASADFILAKGRLSIAMDAYPAHLNEDGTLRLDKARHPLIGNGVVPVDILLEKDKKGLIVTGPNTGGKTVTLKIIGLFVLMNQAGLHIPAGEESTLPVFRGVWADIGDEQSIEQSLSTFSSHMVNIVEILKKAGKNSLVLFDELGAGTDPVEGAALAMAIIETLLQKDSRLVVTTHYSELKAYAYNHPCLVNAGMEFDIDSLRPTYRLLMGVPGRSNAFDIALSLGIDQNLIRKADEFMNEEQKEIHDFLDNLEQGRAGTEKARREAEELKVQLREKEQEIQKREEEFNKKEAELVRKAEERANRIVREKRLAAEEALKEIKEVLNEVSAKKRTEILTRVKKEKEKIDNLNATPEQPEAKGEKLTRVVPGQEVFVPKLNRNGFVLEASGKDVLIQAGIMKITVKLSDLMAVKETKSVDTTSVRSYIREAKSRTVKSEISLRGLTADEALEELSKFIDDAALANLGEIKIIHGLGTGVLKKAVSDYLKKDPRITEQRLGGYYEGGAGVTIATLGQ